VLKNSVFGYCAQMIDAGYLQEDESEKLTSVRAATTVSMFCIT